MVIQGLSLEFAFISLRGRWFSSKLFTVVVKNWSLSSNAYDRACSNWLFERLRGNNSAITVVERASLTRRVDLELELACGLRGRKTIELWSERPIGATTSGEELYLATLVKTTNPRHNEVNCTLALRYIRVPLKIHCNIFVITLLKFWNLTLPR